MINHLAYLIYKKQVHIHMNKMQQNNPIKYYLPGISPHPTPRNCKKRHQKPPTLQNLLLK